MERIEHLGFVLCFQDLTIRLPDRKIARMKVLSRKLLRAACTQSRWISRSLLARTVGYAQSLCPALPLGRFYLNAAYADLAQT